MIITFKIQDRRILIDINLINTLQVFPLLYPHPLNIS